MYFGLDAAGLDNRALSRSLLNFTQECLLPVDARMLQIQQSPAPLLHARDIHNESSSPEQRLQGYLFTYVPQQFSEIAIPAETSLYHPSALEAKLSGVGECRVHAWKAVASSLPRSLRPGQHQHALRCLPAETCI